MISDFEHESLRQLTRISRISLAKVNGGLLATTTLDAELIHSGVHRLETHLGIQEQNMNAPRTLYVR